LIGFWFVLQLLSFGVVADVQSGGAAYVAHIAAMIFGAVTARPLEDPRDPSYETKARHAILRKIEWGDMKYREGGRLLDKPTKDMDPARGWRFPRFLRFGDNGDKTAQPKTTKPPREPGERKHNFAVWYVFAAFLGVMLIQYVWLVYTQVQTIPYSQFEQLLNDNKISEVLVGPDSIQGTLKEPLPEGRKLFYTVRVDPALADKLKAHGVTVAGAPTSNFLSTILSWALPIFIFYLIWTYGIRRMAERQGLGGLMTIGKSRAKIYVETDTKVTFKDVAGVDEAKFELQEVVAYLRDPKSFGRLGARIPRACS
jgi:cell division protease FtsH